MIYISTIIPYIYFFNYHDNDVLDVSMKHLVRLFIHHKIISSIPSLPTPLLISSLPSFAQPLQLSSLLPSLLS